MANKTVKTQNNTIWIGVSMFKFTRSLEPQHENFIGLCTHFNPEETPPPIGPSYNDWTLHFWNTPHPRQTQIIISSCSGHIQTISRYSMSHTCPLPLTQPLIPPAQPQPRSLPLAGARTHKKPFLSLSILFHSASPSLPHQPAWSLPLFCLCLCARDKTSAPDVTTQGPVHVTQK